MSANNLAASKQESGAGGLGIRLREIRKSRALTLKDVAQLSGVSISTLSKLENGKTSLNFRNVLQLAEGLGVPISTFMADVEKARASTARLSVVRSGDATVMTEPQLLFENVSGLIKNKRNVFFRVTVTARSIDDYDNLHFHSGEEFLFVLRGPVEVHTEHYEPVTLATGDSMQFDSGMGHAYVSVGDKDALLLMANTLPTEDTGDLRNG